MKKILAQWTGWGGLEKRLVAHYDREDQEHLDWVSLEAFLGEKWMVEEELISNSLMDMAFSLTGNKL